MQELLCLGQFLGYKNVMQIFGFIGVCNMLAACIHSISSYHYAVSAYEIGMQAAHAAIQL